MHTEGQQPRDGWLWEAATPVIGGSQYACQTWFANTPMATHHRKAILHVRLSWKKPQADLQAKMDDWDQPNQAVLLGRLKCKKKRKLGPTDCRSGSVHVTTRPPLHADKNCLTTEENVTISTSRITRQGRCRFGAAESSLVARNHQPTKTRRPQRTTVDTRLTNSRIVESSGKRDR